MSRSWYCHHVHGHVERRQNIDGSAFYSVQELPCDCRPPPPAAMVMPSHPSVFVMPSIPVVPPCSQQVQQQQQGPALSPFDLLFPPRDSLEVQTAAAVAASVNPAAGADFTPWWALSGPSVPSLVATTAVDGPVPAHSNAHRGSGCGEADHSIYDLCGFAFCPGCGDRLAGGATAGVDSYLCPLPHQHTDPVADGGGGGGGGGERTGHRFCYRCGTSITDPPTPVPPPGQEVSVPMVPLPLPPPLPLQPATTLEAALATAQTPPPPPLAASAVASFGIGGHLDGATVAIPTPPAPPAAVAVPPLVPAPELPQPPPAPVSVPAVVAPSLPPPPPQAAAVAAQPVADAASCPHNVTCPSPPPAAAAATDPSAALFSADDKALIDAVLEKLRGGGPAVYTPQPQLHTSNLQQQQQQAGNGAWTGNASVTIIHNHYYHQ